MTGFFKTFARLSIVMVGNVSITLASNLANPLVPIPAARIGVGVSYHLDGLTITNREIPAIMNRFDVRASYAPITFINFGIGAGASQMEVVRDTSASDTIGVFHGKYDFSWGAHLKLSTPRVWNDRIGLIGIVQGTAFSSENEDGARYKGYDIAGAFGVLVHIPKFGYIAVGPKVYLIAKGLNKSYNNSSEQVYANINNLRGWLAVDFFPPVKQLFAGKPYCTLEVAMSPAAGFKKRAPVQEISFSIGIGTITPRLYGEESNIEWEP
jgi:hypothetical protein